MVILKESGKTERVKSVFLSRTKSTFVLYRNWPFYWNFDLFLNINHILLFLFCFGTRNFAQLSGHFSPYPFSTRTNAWFLLMKLVESWLFVETKYRRVVFVPLTANFFIFLFQLFLSENAELKVGMIFQAADVIKSWFRYRFALTIEIHKFPWLKTFSVVIISSVSSPSVRFLSLFRNDINNVHRSNRKYFIR